jgi:hypothetical protein
MLLGHTFTNLFTPHFLVILGRSMNVLIEYLLKISKKQAKRPIPIPSE